MNKRTADHIVKPVPSAFRLHEKEFQVDTAYVDYNQKRIDLFGTLNGDVSSLEWNVKLAKFLISENRTGCLLCLDLQSQLGVRMTQFRPPSQLVRAILQSEPYKTSEFWRSQYKKKLNHVFTCLSVERTTIKFLHVQIAAYPNSRERQSSPISYSGESWRGKLETYSRRPHGKLKKFTCEHFISPIVISAKKDGSVKVAMDAKPMNDQIHKNHFQMSNLLKFLDSAAQIITSSTDEDIWFTSLDLKYAFGQIPLSNAVSRLCNFNLVCEEQTSSYRFKT